jgi:myo-inositol-1(or 4)-monophosphatase
MNADDPDDWLSLLRPLVEHCIGEVPRLLLSARGRSVVATKQEGGPTLMVESHVEQLTRETLANASVAVTLYGEEGGAIMADRDSRHLVLVDPIDATYLAIRGLPGSCVALCVLRSETMTPIAAVIGDYHDGDIYTATPAGACRNGSSISVSNTTRLEDAYVSTCYGSRARLERMLDRSGVIKGAYWMETTGSMLAMARVATGQIDAYFDLMKGYAPYDFAAGAFIAKMAGAIVTDDGGRALRYPREQTQRCKFVIAATAPLHKAIVQQAVAQAGSVR